jgi:hypothetical protein
MTIDQTLDKLTHYHFKIFSFLIKHDFSSKLALLIVLFMVTSHLGNCIITDYYRKNSHYSPMKNWIAYANIFLLFKIVASIHMYFYSVHVYYLKKNTKIYFITLLFTIMYVLHKFRKNDITDNLILITIVFLFVAAIFHLILEWRWKFKYVKCHYDDFDFEKQHIQNMKKYRTNVFKNVGYLMLSGIILLTNEVIIDKIRYHF